MKKFALFASVALLLSACSAKDTSVSGRIERLNREAEKLIVEKSNRRVTELFNKTIDIAFYNEICSETETLRDDAFDKDNFTNIDLFAEKAKPVYRIVIGGGANFIGSDVGFFLTKSFPETPEYKFFELALTGWVDLNGEMHGGKDNFPAWIDQVDDESGNFKADAGAEALMKWKSLLPELNGNYKQIAWNTIAYIEKMMKGK